MWPATAFAAPTPSPSLTRLLAPPPSAQYVEDTEASGTPIGNFDAADYVSFLQPDDPATAQSSLAADGFVTGWGKSWTELSTGRALVELVVAFSGGRGAREWLTSSEASARAAQYYKGSITVGGIGRYFGVHYADPTAPSYADVVDLVKGNDFFVVGYVSQASDMGNAAAIQAKAQYDFAAPASIPPSDWPENSNGASRLVAAATLAAATAGIALVVIAVALIGFMVWRTRQAGIPSPAGAPQMSPDGRYWWDGQAWREVRPPPS